ncbi:phosphoesterase RecJ domain protein [Ruminiclostridium papyrosolvens DSM 2782]|uniref:Cyclic-di-AMP phosphodiesterase n=1 Tax=Ruminiclostridium papyrosolvens DSM 2782 TaxID=588581 RepID=F1TCN1_9FIRM|nr:DHH family phosphoesterase [Ruminiclostridium papyrosolvens]EGD47748.1 phosphoesterase RecJ domain protein [Ruminiclostridium papyrosolvens DSM 2782]WES34465.1 DHH family phosphoesterase [Ruminiclostridium papyrosolvens DSM 2782]
MDSRKLSRIFIPKAGFYLWVIFFLIIVITVLNPLVSIPGYILLVFLVIYNYKSTHIRNREITKYIETLTFNIDCATKDTLLNFPMPLVLAELDGTTVWYNSSFKGIFQNDTIQEETVAGLVSDLKPQMTEGDSINISSEITINNRHYSVLGNLVKLDDSNNEESVIVMLYLVDNTELIDEKKKFEDNKNTVGLVVIDNYDDLMQSMEDAVRQQLLAEIDKKVTSWISHTGGVLKKFERDKYLCIFAFKYLQELEEKRFEILETVKEINLGNKIPVTLSIGLGINAPTIVENLQNANACIDIALGRGGDHVVIKDGDNFRFFGGRTRELEKRTRVKARVIAYALRGLIDQAPSVLIMGHENADIDCLGAALGIHRIVKNRDKRVNIVLNHSNANIDAILNKMSKEPEYTNVFVGTNEALDLITKKTLLIVVDTHKPGFTEAPELLKMTDQVVIIDHHRRGADFIQDAVLSYQETYASSTCELVTELLQYVEDRIRLTNIETEALYAGIVVDTKNFIFKTGVRTFEAASYLRRQGADTVSVKQLFQNDLKTYITISNIVKDAEVVYDNIAISICPNNIKGAQLIAAQAADQLLSLSGLVAAFVLSYHNGEVVISGRSLGDINVQMILEKLGGGGHLTVAGAQIEDVTIQDAKKMLKDAIYEYIDSLAKE